MEIELIKIEKSGACNWYCVKVNNEMVINSETGSIKEAEYLYNSIIEDPSILTVRQIIVKSQTI